MLLYTHLALAQFAQTRIQPAYLNEFAWGTVIPDIYGLAEIPRNQTHFTREGLERLMARFPEQRSFVQGYRVHLLLDELDQNKINFQSIPSAHLRGLFFDEELSRHSTNLFIEDYFTHTTPFHKLPIFSEKYNAILDDFGFSPTLISDYARRIKKYLSALWFQRNCDPDVYLNPNHSSSNVCVSKDRNHNPILIALMRYVVKNAGFEKAAMAII